MRHDYDMANVMVAAMPFTGHVLPMLALVDALVARGEDVRVYTGGAFRERVERAGARFTPWHLAPDFDENDLAATFPRLVGKKGLGQVFINLQDCMIGTAPAQVSDLAAEWGREPWDVIVGDEMSIGAAHVAEKLGCPWATVAVLPLHMAGTQGPPAGLAITPGTNPVTKTRDALLRAMVPVLARPLQKPLARARQASALPPSSLTFDKAVFSPQIVIASGSPLLDFGRTDRPDHLHFVGELRAPASRSHALPPWWGDLDGRTVVHVTQGTQNIDPTDLLAPATTALADRDVLVVATTGVAGRDELPFEVPSNVRVAGFVPYAQLLPRVSVVVSNGGWGGTLATLSHSIPLILAGGDLDKPEIAARVAWAGAGVNLRTGTPSAMAVRDAFDRVAGDASFRDAAARVGAQLQSLGGAVRAAELVAGLAA